MLALATYHRPGNNTWVPCSYLVRGFIPNWCCVFKCKFSYLKLIKVNLTAQHVRSVRMNWSFGATGNAYCDWWTDKAFLCHVKTLALIGWNSFSFLIHCHKGVFCNEHSQEGIACVQRSPISFPSGGKSPFSTWSKGNRRRLQAGYNKNGQNCFENSCGYTKSTIEHMLLTPGIVRRNKTTTDQYRFSHFFSHLTQTMTTIELIIWQVLRVTREKKPTVGYA